MVYNPIKVSGHFKYSIRGVDEKGEFEELRRYNEFKALHSAFCARWPGLYVPDIPGKKKFGVNEKKHIEERRELLERFLKEIARFPFLTESKEF